MAASTAVSAPGVTDASAPPVLLISVTAVARILGGGAVLLVILALVAYAIHYGLGYGLKDSSIFYYYFLKFDLAREMNFPAWYSSILLMLCAVLSAVIAVLRHCEQQPLRWHWSGLALIFLGLSADEIAVIHELTVGPLRRTFDPGGLLWFAWVILAIPAVILVGLIYLPFLARLPRMTAGRILAAGLVFVSGSVGLEMIGGAIAEDQGFTELSYIFAMTCEEAAEMAGLILYIRALLLHVRDHMGDIALRLR
jgi:hypothetical protein